jgi:hypothetical protein
VNPKLTFVVISSTNDLSVEKTLESIAGVGRILLIDGGARKHFSSLKGEISLARLAEHYSCEYRARNFINAADQYNFGIENVETEWTFIIDSDETLSSGLIDFLEKGNFASATHYSVKRVNNFLGRSMRHGQFRPDWNIRLIKTKHCKYEVRSVHARMLTVGKGERAPGFMIHDTVQDVDSFFLKMLEFTKLEIDSRLKKNLSTESKAKFRAVLQKLPFQASLRFIYSYWYKLGFLDGRTGYLVAKSASYYEVMVQLHALERDG